ncbi:MAG: hypothetical protein H0X14_05130, partial [Acidobacteria bacterium]|nr:hypothetical protein [Acidobacteriota bacterium]
MASRLLKPESSESFHFDDKGSARVSEENVAGQVEDIAQEAPILTFVIPEADRGARLDAYLAAHVADWSRSRIQRLIEDGDVLVAGHTVKSSYKLRAGDT